MDKKKIHFLFVLFIFIFSLASSISHASKEKNHTEFPYNPLVSPDLWEELKPYFLPIQHPIRTGLDQLFQTIRATQSPDHFEKGGFGKPVLRKPTNVVIGEHPSFKKVIFKVFLDIQPQLSEWILWIHRIDGARAIQECINRHDFLQFIVPNKWIYPLPLNPSPPDHPKINRKNFILIVQKMNILPPKENLKAFKEKITPQLLDQLYIILTEEGLIDSVYPDNIPFTKEGKIAFIDTEHRYPGRAVPYEVLTPYLSADMQKYWHALIK